jgi:thioredoxin-dependent peroxiredoxin
MVEVGTRVPVVRLPDQDGELVDLSTFRGQPIVIYFYPRDETRGCTMQACGIRDHWSEFQQAGAQVFGISADGVESHARFAGRHQLPFRLLADPDREVIDAFDAWGWRTRQSGERVEGVLRTTVLVDRDGNVAAVWTEVDPTTHADQVLEALGSLSS